MLETIGYIILAVFAGIWGFGGMYLMYSFIRDDRRQEKERKNKLLKSKLK